MPRKPQKGSSRIYFTEATEDAIVVFNETDDELERERIYRDDLERPFDKMAESIINRFKFPYVDNSFEETKQQVISFITLNLWRYTKEKGKAFSYFSVIAKNYLILHNTNAYKHEKRITSMTDTETELSLEEVLELDVIDPEDKRDTNEFISLMVDYWEDNIPRMFKKNRDIKIANAVVELFRRANYIENYNKKALYLMIREQTNCKTSYITKVINKMYEHYVEQKVNYNTDGLVGTDEYRFFKY